MQRECTRTVVRRCIAIQLSVIGVLAMSSFAGVQEFEDEERPLWFDAASDVGTITTIDFTGFASGTFVSDQYQDVGVTFTPGDDEVNFIPSSFLEDGWGIDGNAFVRVLFDEPQIGIAFDHPAASQVNLYRDGELVLESMRFGGGGPGHFGGVVGIQFDEAIIVDWLDDAVFIDDIHFVSVPAPATLPMVSALFALRTRRRTSR